MQRLTDIQKKIAAAKRTALEDAYVASIRAIGLPEPKREYRFCVRRWRFDFFWELRRSDESLRRTAAEIDGGTWMRGRHNRGKGFEEDCRKRNAAALLDIRVLTFTREMVKSLEAAQVTKQALGL